MNVDLGIWDKLTKAILVLLFLAVVLGVALWYLPLIQQNERMRAEDLRIQKSIQQEDDKLRQLKASSDALRFDKSTVERLAREKLSYAKPGETVYRFEPATNTPSARP
jgi:cell division protein FtsB